MREFKFRAWSSKWEKMINNISINSDIIIWTFNPDYGESEWDYLNDDIHIMQFTGLLDKNGKEVFENDIVRSKYNYQVIFENGSFYLYHLEHKNWDGKNLQWGLLNRMYDSDMKYLFKDLEVIGNIYENPELLEVKNNE